MFHFQGEAAHQHIKKFYQRTNKKNLAGQIAKQDRRHTRVRRQCDAYYVDPNGSIDPKNDPAEVPHQ